MASSRKPSLAVYKFSSCDGCQLSLLNMEDELLDLAEAVEIAYFLEARRRTQSGPYDVALVEGCVSTPDEAERIQEVRRQSRFLVALGTCATAGGIQALRNFADVNEYAQTVYAHPEYLNTLTKATPLSEHVQVNLELWGCPVNKAQVLEVITALLQNRRPNLPQHSVCLDCKRRSTVCVLVAHGTPCLGPVTQAGCGALCPSHGRGCYGCFGPTLSADVFALVPKLRQLERQPGETLRLLRHVSGYAPAFAQAADSILAEEEQA